MSKIIGRAYLKVETQFNQLKKLSVQLICPSCNNFSYDMIRQPCRYCVKCGKPLTEFTQDQKNEIILGVIKPLMGESGTIDLKV